MSNRKSTGAALLSAARTATPADILLDKTSLGASGQALINMHIIIDVTAIAATPSVVPTIVATDKLSGQEYVLLTGSAITGVSTTVLKVGRDMVPAANLAEQDFIPDNTVLRFTHADADSITYSVGINAEFDSYI